ncbi:MAG TPA: hypothetical protein DHV36_23290 [Desulfobacteraceae bacterium]|nr:hypothetical protein [Desulfobacteraceae bacterium]
MPEKPTYEELEKRICELEKRYLADLPINNPEHYHKMLDCSPSVIYSKDVNGRYTSINRQFEKLSGLKRKDILSKTDFELFPESVARNSVANDKRVMETGAPLEVEEFGPVDGRMHIFSSIKYPLTDDNGDIYGICGVSTDISEKKEYENAAQESRALLEATNRMARVGGWELDLQTQKVLWTRMTGKIHGLPDGFVPSLEEAISYYHPDDRQMVEEHVNRAVEKGLPYEFDARLMTKDGQQLWVRAMGEPIMEDGRCVKLTGTFQDITSLMQATISRKQSEEKFRSLFENMSSGVAVYDATENGDDFIFKDFNKAAEALENVSRHALQAKRLTDVFPGAKRFGIYDVLRRVWRTGESEHFGPRFYSDDRDPGTWREAWVYKLSGGEVVAVYNDVTAQKAAEEKIRESEILFRTIFDRAPLGISIIDSPTGRFLQINETFCRILGYTASQMLDMDFMQITHPEDLQEDLDNMAQLRAGEISSFQMEKRYIRKDRQIVWVSLTVSPLWEHSEKTTHMAIVEDITLRKQTQLELEMSRKDLLLKTKILHTMLTSEGGNFYDEVLSMVLQGMKSEYGFFGYIDDDSNMISPSMTTDIWDKCKMSDKRASFPKEKWAGLWGKSLKEKRLQVSNGSLSPPEGHLPIRRAAACPIIHSDQLVGQITVANKKGDYTQKDISWLQDISEFIAPILFTRIQKDKEEKRRSEAEKALVESEEKYRKLFETMSQGVVYQNATGEIVSVNPAAEKILGRTFDQMRGVTSEDTGWRCIREDGTDFPGEEHPSMVALRSGAPVEDIVMGIYIPETDAYRWLVVNAVPQFHPDERHPFQVYSTFDDITERQQAKRQLEESELKYRNLFSSIRDAILIADTKRKIVGCNPAFTDLFGYSETEVLGRPTRFVYESEHQFLELGKKLKENVDNTSFVYTVRYRKKSGEIFHGESGVFYLKNADGEITGFIGLIRNVEERLKAEQKLKRSEARLKSLVDNLFDAVIVTDRTGVIRFANTAACKLFGKEAHDMIGLEFGFPITMDEAFEISISQQGKGFRQVEARATAADWHREAAHLISLHDITERVVAQQERDKINLQLQQSQKIESIGKLAGGVAHDFNNMLTIILSYGQELLRDLHPSDPLHECAVEIVDAGKRSADLTRQLLAFSRKQTLQPEVLNLNSIIQNIEKVLRRLIGEDIELQTKLAKDLVSVEVDPGQIEQVIMNLAVNARDAMPVGGKLIIETENTRLDAGYAESHPGAVPGEYIMIAVTDTGCGMDKDTLAKVFEPFFTTKEKGRGTGLGLSTVYGIVKQSGGNIWVYSEPEQGTTFKIYLPQSAKPLSDGRMAIEENSIRGKKEFILVVEDEPSLRKLCTRTLESLNYEVKSASNGGEALLLIEEKKWKPDLILTDVVMPEMSGKVLIDRLKRTLPDIKVLYMSGYTDDAIVHHGILNKETPFIQKPFTIEKLGKEILNILSNVS